MQHDTWVYDESETWYYMKSDGSMLTNGYTPSGMKVDGDGHWIPEESVEVEANEANE